ncbi:MAG: heavy-metal-associated domain-containing protein [Flavobacteriales bacterium]|nr:heavy-metal-associated domain-containing protein [Flavobacteriales bacterium]
MSLYSENIIPGNYGKVFEVNATEDSDLQKIKTKILELEGITDVIINKEEFPIKLNVHTDEIVAIKDVEQAVISLGFHAVPKSLFSL